MNVFALKIAVTAVRALAALIGLFVRRRDGIVLISCQGDQPSQDILDIAETLRNIPDTPRVVVTSGLMERSLGGAFSFFRKMVSMLKKIAAARVVVIDAYCPAVSIPKKRTGQKVVQLWHAPEAIKKFSLQIIDTPAGYDSATAMILNMHQGYDYILCPSGATLPFFEEAFGYPESAFVKYGLPSLDRLGIMKRYGPDTEDGCENAGETQGRAAAAAAICERYPALKAEEFKRPFVVVYAPTFRDGEEVDASGLDRAFKNAARETEAFHGQWSGLTLVLKLHPLNAIKSGAQAEGGGISLSRKPAQEDKHVMDADHTGGDERKVDYRVIVDTDFSLIEWYAVADAIVTDYSGVAVEAAAAGVASYYYVYDIDEYAEKRGLNVDLREETVGKYAFTDANALAVQALKDFADGGAHVKNGPFQYGSAYDFKALSAFAGKYLETPLKGNTQRLAKFISEL